MNLPFKTRRASLVLPSMAIGAAMAIFLAVTTGFFGHGFVDDSWIGLR